MGDDGLTVRLRARIVADFGAAAADVVAVLRQHHPPLGDNQDRERLLAAVVLLAGADQSKFESALAMSHRDWRDTLVASGLGNGDWPARLTDALGPDVELVSTDAGSADARWAMQAYFDELADRFGFDPGDALSDAVLLMNPPNGVFLLARWRGAVVGCGGVQVIDERTAEIKRMWIAPDARGLGLGRLLLTHLEDEARGLGRHRVVLDTNGVLHEAIAMYRACGYADIERYNENPFAEHWFAKELGQRT